MIEQFSLEKYLENPSRKVVTRDGREAIIVSVNADDKFPVVAKIQGWDAPFVELFNRDGIHSLDWDGCIFDLFFADEEEELTEFEKELNRIVTAFSATHAYMDETEIHHYSKGLIDLARKELLKDLPKVETTIVNDWQYGKDPDHAIIPAIHQRIEGFDVGDKVKIIIVKEEQQ